MTSEKRFVGISRARDIRITNLETAKEVIKSTKSYYRLEMTRNKKLNLLNGLKKECKELSLLFTKLYDFFPDHEILEGRKKPSMRLEQTKIKRRSKSTLKSKKDHSESEIEKLEKALANVESKLKDL